MPGRFVALQLQQSNPRRQSTGRRRRDWLPVSKAGTVLQFTNNAPASCDHSSFCELFSAFKRVATECEIHDYALSRQGSNWNDERRRFMAWRAGEPGLNKCS